MKKKEANKLKLLISTVACTLLVCACDSDNSPTPVECPRHTVECNNECVFVDEIIIYNKDCLPKKES